MVAPLTMLTGAGALLTVILHTGTTLLAAPVALAATTALVLGGTGEPDPSKVPGYIPKIERQYFPFTSCQAPSCRVVPTFAPLEGIPFAGNETFDQSLAASLPVVDKEFHDQLNADPTGHFVLAGTSQGALVWAMEKANFAKDPSAPAADQVEFVFIDNESRPNGGLLARFPKVTIPFLITLGQVAPTDTGYKTLDVAMQYDGFADFPAYPLNALADLNALAGVIYIHSSDVSATTLANSPLGLPTTRTGPDGYTQQEFDELLNDPANQQQHGDTTYITIPTKQLPILQPLRDFGAFTGTTSVVKPIVDLVEPAMRVLIETGYDRTASYGQPVMASLIPALNPVKLAVDLAAAAGQGTAQALHDLGLVPKAAATSATTTSTHRDENTVDPSTKRVEVTKPKVDVPKPGNDTDVHPTRIKRHGIQNLKSTGVTKSESGAGVSGAPGSKPHGADAGSAGTPSKATGSESGASSSKTHSPDKGGAPSKKAGGAHRSTPTGHHSHRRAQHRK
jgi:PE-PPE domain